MPKQTKNIRYYEAVGRRKRSTARVRLYLVGKDKTAAIQNVKVKAGEVNVNGKLIETVFSGAYAKQTYSLPLRLTNSLERFAVSVTAHGGGKQGQLDAIVLGISRALQLVDQREYTPILKSEHLLTRDPRKKERRKVGTGGKARRAKQSPKR